MLKHVRRIGFQWQVGFEKHLKIQSRRCEEHEPFREQGSDKETFLLHRISCHLEYLPGLQEPELTITIVLPAMVRTNQLTIRPKGVHQFVTAM